MVIPRPATVVTVCAKSNPVSDKGGRSQDRRLCKFRISQVKCPANCLALWVEPTAIRWAISSVRARRRAGESKVTAVPRPLPSCPPALLLVPSDAAVLLVLGFVLHYVQDRRLARVAGLPEWYLPLRLRLTTVACIALISGAFVQWPY